MAGDWIKMRVDLNDDPAVIAIAAETGLDEYEVVGRLHKFWSWADRHSVDGNALCVTRAWIDRYLQCDNFAEALFQAGWLGGNDGMIDLPNFDRHNGESAKKRAQTNKRVAEHRERKRDGNADSVTGGVTGSVTKSVTREEKRREEKEPSADTDLFDEFWSAYPRKDSKADARKAFGKLKVSAEFLPTILAGLERAKKSDQWKKDGGQYVPYAATWLNGHRWEDGEGTSGETGGWWAGAGFTKEWQAINAGCTSVSAHLWRDGQRVEV